MQEKIKERLKRHSLFILAAKEKRWWKWGWSWKWGKIEKNFLGACQHFSSSSLELSKLITQQQQQHSKKTNYDLCFVLYCSNVVIKNDDDGRLSQQQKSRTFASSFDFASSSSSCKREYEQAFIIISRQCNCKKTHTHKKKGRNRISNCDSHYYYYCNKCHYYKTETSFF